MVTQLALHLLLALESANGSLIGKEKVGGSVGLYHLRPATIRNLDISLRNTTDSGINRFIENNPDYEKALVNLLLEQLSLNLKKQSPNQKLALLSFGYNLGVGKMITLRNKLTNCGTENALFYMIQFVKANGKTLNGLKKRRLTEAGLLNKDRIEYNNIVLVTKKDICYRNFDWDLTQQVIDIQFRH